MPSRGTMSGALAALACLATVAAAQTDADRRVIGTVRDETGNAIAGAEVRIVACATGHSPLLLAVALAEAPLPSTRSAKDGSWSLVLPAAFQHFSTDSHVPLALVVEAAGHQPWRELLPAPAALYGGSDVVLRARSSDDDATVVVPEAIPGAIVRVRRVDDAGLGMGGGRPPGEVQDHAVPADGKLVVNVPLLPTPPVLAAGARGAAILWTAQLLAPGHSTAAMPLTPGSAVTLTPTRAPAPAAIAMAPKAGGERVARRALAKLPGGDLHWFPAVDGRVGADAHVSATAVEYVGNDGRVWLARWPDPGDAPVGPPASTLRFLDPDGAAVRDVTVFWCAPTELGCSQWTGNRLLPHGRARRERPTQNTVAIERPAEQPCVWIAAPGHLPQFLLDVRTLPSVGGIATVVLTPATAEFTVRVRDDEGRPLAGARILAWQAETDAGGSRARCGLFLAHDGQLPRTDTGGECRLPHTSEFPDVTVLHALHRTGGGTFEASTRVHTCVATRLVPWRVRTTAADSKAVPFAIVGCNVDLSADGSGTQFTTHDVCTDSRGEGTLLAPVKPTPQLGPSRLGSFGERGTTLRADAVTTIEVDQEPIVVVRMPANASRRTRAAYVWERAVAGTPLGVEDYGEPHRGRDWWLRWPRELRLWVTDSPDAPPVAIARAAVSGAMTRIDGATIVRSTPLTLRGELPKDVAALRAVPFAIAGETLQLGLGGEYLAPDRSALRLQTSDLLAHTVLLLHPELLPTRVTIAAGDAGREPVAATPTRGAPLLLALRFDHPVTDRRLVLVARDGDETIAAAELFDARLATEEVTKGIEVRAPFALPAGKVTLQLGWNAPQDIVVAGTAAVRATFTSH